MTASVWCLLLSSRRRAGVLSHENRPTASEVPRDRFSRVGQAVPDVPVPARVCFLSGSGGPELAGRTSVCETLETVPLSLEPVLGSCGGGDFLRWQAVVGRGPAASAHVLARSPIGARLAPDGLRALSVRRAKSRCVDLRGPVSSLGSGVTGATAGRDAESNGHSCPWGPVHGSSSQGSHRRPCGHWVWCPGQERKKRLRLDVDGRGGRASSRCEVGVSEGPGLSRGQRPAWAGAAGLLCPRPRLSPSLTETRVPLGSPAG